MPRSQSTQNPAHARDRIGKRLEMLWQPPILISVVFAGEMLAAILALAPGITGSRWMHFGLTSLLIQWISLLTLGLLSLLRRPLGQLRPLAVAYFAFAALLVITGAVCSLVWLLLRNLLHLPDDAWWSLWLQFSGIALAVGLVGLAIFRSSWNTHQLAIRAKQAELDALQARIHPHFLFNTLNTGVALIHERPEATEQLLLDLADLFRAALAGPQEIELSQELALTRRYLEIEALRFGSRLRIEWQLPSPLPALPVPTLGIQTLAENAVRHGVEPSAAGGKVVIAVVGQADAWEISVANDLPTSSTTPNTGHRIGLDAVRSRVHALTAGRGRVETRVEGGCYVATIVLPRPAFNQVTTR
jgi:two-component system sensor histidine kinase AlgZ